MTRHLSWLPIIFAAACFPSFGDDANGNAPDPTNAAIQGVGKMGARRLTRNEYDNTLLDVLGDTSFSGSSMLPEDALSPYDNDYTTQQPSQSLIDAAETLAENAANSLLADTARRDKVVGCTPTGADDAVCLRSFITSIGRRLLRRALSDDEIADYLSFQQLAIQAGDFYTGVELVLRTLLQEPEFLYRIEVGTPVDGRPGLYRLNSWERASRLSYFLIGSAPDDTLLDLAASDQLQSSATMRAQAQRLLSDPRAQDRVKRFHAFWLGYSQMSLDPDLNAAMKAETDALIGRVVFDEQKSWMQLFQAQETYINDVLADQYGLPHPGTPSWVSWGATARKGILSEGAYLSAAAKPTDTSPTLRGKFVRTRLLCEEIPPPPPDVNVDAPPASVGPCKSDHYATYAVGTCANCHARMDPIGLGLENYDRAGKYRTHDDDNASCIISGNGSIEGMGNFNGPAQLSDLLVNNSGLDDCLVKQVYRYAMGHREADGDMPLLSTLSDAFRSDDHHFDQLIVELCAQEAFGYRVEE
jgi:hypothetical protein